MHNGRQHVGAPARGAMRLPKPASVNASRSHIALNALGQLFHRQSPEFAKPQGNQRINGQFGIAAAFLVYHRAAKLQVGRWGGQAHWHDILRIGAGG